MNSTADALPALSSPCEPHHLEILIRTRSYGRVRDLHLELRREGLILRGRASSYYVKQLAQQAVLEAGELPLLANEIEVTIDREALR